MHLESDLPDDRASRAPSFAGRRSASPAASRIKKRNRKSGGVAERTLRKLLLGAEAYASVWAAPDWRVDRDRRFGVIAWRFS